jgi:hypothetical protein
MKRSIPLLVIALLAPHTQAALVAFWDFNNGFDAGVNSIQVVHNASIGTGTLYQQRADIDGNGKGGVAFVDVPNGINAAIGQAMAWDDIAKSGDNDAEFFLVFSTLGLQGVSLSFDLRGNSGIIPGFDLKYSTTPLDDVLNPGDVIGTVKDFAGGISTEVFNNYTVNASDVFTRITLDLSSITGLNNQSYVAIRLDDFDSGTGNNDMRIDNVMITAIPEPSTALLGGLSLLSLLRRRRA